MILAYSRFGWDGDVYVYLDVRGHLCCCACWLGDKWEFYSTDEMIAHLEEHKKAGHTVPDSLIPHLLADKEENDNWIKNYDPEVERLKDEAAEKKRKDIWKIAKEEFDYVHPGPEKFDYKRHSKVWKEASLIYETRIGHA